MGYFVIVKREQRLNIHLDILSKNGYTFKPPYYELITSDSICNFNTSVDKK